MTGRSGCLGFHSFETLLLVLTASGNFRDDKSKWGEHMAITYSEAVRIWVIVTLAMYLLSLHAEEPLSLTPIFFLTSVPFHLQLPLPGCSLPRLPPPPADILPTHLSGSNVSVTFS